MKIILLVIIVLFFALFVMNDRDTCSFAQNAGDLGPRRLVIIKGKATIINLKDVGETAATSETLIFQKVGCESCYVGANVDIDGNYKVLVGDGKYKIIVNSPSSPEVDLLAPDQKRFVDTGSKNSPDSVFNFDIKIKSEKAGSGLR